MIASILFVLGACACAPIVVDFQLAPYQSIPEESLSINDSWIPSVVCAVPSELSSFSAECGRKLMWLIAPKDETGMDRVSLDELADSQKRMNLDISIQWAGAELKMLRYRILDRLFFGKSKPTDADLSQLIDEVSQTVDPIMDKLPEHFQEFKEQFTSIIHSFLLPKIHMRVRGDPAGWDRVPGSFCAEELRRYLELAPLLSERIDAIMNDKVELEGKQQITTDLLTKVQSVWK